MRRPSGRRTRALAEPPKETSPPSTEEKMTQSNASELPRAYDPQQVEGRIYQSWLDGGYFTAAVDRGRKPFVIIQPPPNVTGSSTWVTRSEPQWRTR